ncbi:MAG: hypothetical protein K6G55_00325 [Selenomonadaceae bacterium]|nr:hypothetical protein [Selenomonadaceae bacterium]
MGGLNHNQHPKSMLLQPRRLTLVEKTLPQFLYRTFKVTEVTLLDTLNQL